MALWTPAIEPLVGTVDPPEYTLTEGHFLNNQSTFTLFCHMPLIFYAERHALEFLTADIDGYTLTLGTQFAATTGTTQNTTAIHLAASYLNTLAPGTYTLRVNFTHGVYANAQFTIEPYTNTILATALSPWHIYAWHLRRTASGTRKG